MSMTPAELAGRLAAAELDMQEAMTRIVLTVEGKAKRVTPVDTGTLRRSITHRVESAGERGVVGTNVEYAPFVHEGTRRMAARPFLVQGMEASRTEIERILERAGVKLFTRIAR